MNPINLNNWRRDYYACKGRTDYLWSVKPQNVMTQWPPTDSDCSGWISAMLVRRAWPQELLGMGSHQLGDWLQAQGFHKPDSLSDVIKYAGHDPGRLFACGYDKGGTNRHILTVCAGYTMECAHGLGGVGSRSASAFVDEIDTGDWFRWIVELPVVLS